MIKTVLFVHGLESGPTGARHAYLHRRASTSSARRCPAAARGRARPRGDRRGGVCGVRRCGEHASLGRTRPRAHRRRRARGRTAGPGRPDAPRPAPQRGRADPCPRPASRGRGGRLVVRRCRWCSSCSGAARGRGRHCCSVRASTGRRARARLDAPSSLASLPDVVSSRIVVVHGRGDQTVPVAHTQALVAGSRARLILVDDDHRLSASATPERFVEWIALTEG